MAGEPFLANRIFKLLATVSALAYFNPMRKVLSPACEGWSSCLRTFSITARFSFELDVTMIALEYGSLVMRTLP